MDKKGFSLPEVLAVLVILGVLLMIAVPSISRVKEEVEKKRVKGDAETFLALAKDYIESNANVEGTEKVVNLSDIDKTKLNGEYSSGTVKGLNCELAGIRYKCKEFRLELVSNDTPYKATKNETGFIKVERKEV